MLLLGAFLLKEKTMLSVFQKKKVTYKVFTHKKKINLFGQNQLSK